MDIRYRKKIISVDRLVVMEYSILIEYLKFTIYSKIVDYLSVMFTSYMYLHKVWNCTVSISFSHGLLVPDNT